MSSGSEEKLSQVGGWSVHRYGAVGWLMAILLKASFRKFRMAATVLRGVQVADDKLMGKRLEVQQCDACFATPNFLLAQAAPEVQGCSFNMGSLLLPQSHLRYTHAQNQSKHRIKTIQLSLQIWNTCENHWCK